MTNLMPMICLTEILFCSCREQTR